MSDWKKEYSKGKDYNFDENFNSALECLEKALSDCPENDKNATPMIIFEIGRSLYGQGQKGAAVGCMLAALKMGMKEPHIENMMHYLLNEYGMPAMDTAERDDKEAFKSIQVMRYLSLKKSGRFGTNAEKDMILDLIAEAWTEFSANNNFSGLTAREKIHLFRCCVIIFPTINIIKDNKCEGNSIVFADFGKNLCSCGSGLPYMWCCGRIKTIEELESGAL